jgi:hypothetical protein
MLKYRSRRWSIKKLRERRFTKELLLLENRDLHYKGSQHSSSDNRSDFQFLKAAPNPADLTNSLSSVNPDIYELAQEEIQNVVSDLNQIRAPSVDLAILKNEVFQSLTGSVDVLDSDSDHKFKYSSIEKNMDRQSMEFQMRESMVKYNKHLPKMEKIVKLEQQFHSLDRKLCKSCIDDRVVIPNVRVSQRSDAETQFKEWMSGKYHRSLKKKLMLFSQKGDKCCQKSDPVQRFVPKSIRRSVKQNEMYH